MQSFKETRTTPKTNNSNLKRKSKNGIFTYHIDFWADVIANLGENVLFLLSIIPLPYKNSFRESRAIIYLYAGRYKEFERLVKLIKNQNEHNSLLEYAYTKNDVKAMEIILNNGTPDKDTKNNIMLYVARGIHSHIFDETKFTIFCSMAELLLKAGADLYSIHKDEQAIYYLQETKVMFDKVKDLNKDNITAFRKIWELV